MKAYEQKLGLVAILDALGAASYTDREIWEFLESRRRVLTLLKDKAGDLAATYDVSKVKTYTFNDTLLIVLEFGEQDSCRNEIEAFAMLLRKVFVDALSRRIMFRGSIALGQFYEDSETNTILGRAVTDAAAWYDKADWIGIHATPSTSIHIDELLKRGEDRVAHILVRYSVPMTDGSRHTLWTVNWPKLFWVPNVVKPIDGKSPRQHFMKMLGKFSIPKGAENKHYNAIAYFDTVMDVLKLKE